MHCEDLFLEYCWNHLSSEVILSLPWLLLLTPENSGKLFFWRFIYEFLVLLTAFFFLFTIKSLQFFSHWLQILNYFLGMCLAFESPGFNANTFDSDSNPNINQLFYLLGGCKSSMSHGMQRIFILPWIHLMQPNTTVVEILFRCNGSCHTLSSELTHCIELCLIPKTCLNICLKTF